MVAKSWQRGVGSEESLGTQVHFNKMTRDLEMAVVMVEQQCECT